MILNRNISRYWRSLFIPAAEFSSVHKVASTLSALTLVEGAPNTLGSATISSSLTNAVQTANLLSEVNSTGLFGVKINTAGHAVRHLMAWPWDYDNSKPLYARIYWTSGSSDTADTIAWKLFYKARSANNDLLTATIDTALTTVIPSDTVPTASAYTLCRTEKGTLAANTVRPNDLAEIEVELDAFAGGLAEDKFFLGVEFLYVPLIGNDTNAATPTLPTDW